MCECNTVGAFVCVCVRDVELGHKYYEGYRNFILWGFHFFFS